MFRFIMAIITILAGLLLLSETYYSDNLLYINIALWIYWFCIICAFALVELAHLCMSILVGIGYLIGVGFNAAQNEDEDK